MLRLISRNNIRCPHSVITAKMYKRDQEIIVLPIFFFHEEGENRPTARKQKQIYGSSIADIHRNEQKVTQQDCYMN